VSGVLLVLALLATAFNSKSSQTVALPKPPHAALRSPGERANPQLKTWRILRKLRCCPWRTGQLAKSHPRPDHPRSKSRMKKAHTVDPINGIEQLRQTPGPATPTHNQAVRAGVSCIAGLCMLGDLPLADVACG
jgi:hypothetical protein